MSIECVTQILETAELLEDEFTQILGTAHLCPDNPEPSGEGASSGTLLGGVV